MEAKISTVNQVRDNNTQLILKALRTVPCGTKNSISQITGLSIATCNTMLNELESADQVCVVKSEQPTAGRPPKVYQFNADYAHICCIYFVDEDFKRIIHYSITNLLGDIVANGMIEKNHIDAQVVIDTIDSLINRYPRIQKISMGISGYLNQGRIASCGIDELLNVPLKQIVSDHFQMETHCNNDMNTIALGLFRDINPNSEDPFCVIGLMKGKNPGAGTIVNRSIVKGMTNFAGEILNLEASDVEFWSNMDYHYPEALQRITRICCSFITILNPNIIILTGKNTSVRLIKDLRNECSLTIPKEHLPEFRHISDVETYYINGLYEKTNNL